MTYLSIQFLPMCCTSNVLRMDSLSLPSRLTLLAPFSISLQIDSMILPTMKLSRLFALILLLVSISALTSLLIASMSLSFATAPVPVHCAARPVPLDENTLVLLLRPSMMNLSSLAQTFVVPSSSSEPSPLPLVPSLSLWLPNPSRRVATVSKLYGNWTCTTISIPIHLFLTTMILHPPFPSTNCLPSMLSVPTPLSRILSSPPSRIWTLLSKRSRPTN